MAAVAESIEQSKFHLTQPKANPDPTLELNQVAHCPVRLCSEFLQGQKPHISESSVAMFTPHTADGCIKPFFYGSELK